MHRFLLHNGKVREAADPLLTAGQVGLLNGWGVFSTIRVIDGVLFAFDRHFERMMRDAETMRVPFPADAAPLESALLLLVEANQAWNATLRVSVIRNKGGMWTGPEPRRDYDVVAFTAEKKNWGEGVRLGIVPDARHSASPFAGTKILSWSHNLAWLEGAQSRGLDEVILLNERGRVSECTSANIFISEGNRIWTTPLSSGCLPGITRQILLNDVRVPGVQLGEKDLELADLEAADEVFITSTTRGLLPVLEVEGLRIRNAGAAREPVQAAFRDYVAAYVERAKR